MVVDFVQGLSNFVFCFSRDVLFVKGDLSRRGSTFVSAAHNVLQVSPRLENLQP